MTGSRLALIAVTGLVLWSLLDPDTYRPHGDGGLIVDTIAGTTYITIHATEPPLGVDLPTPPAVVIDGQDPLIGDDT